MTFRRKSNQQVRRGVATPQAALDDQRAAPSRDQGDGQRAAPSRDQGDGQQAAPQEGIPPHVWSLLQEAGEEAAGRLVDLLRSRKFDAFPPSAQKALIELGLTRAYGLPVRRSVAVNLSSDDADAVAASMLDLRDRLPERTPQPRNVTPDDHDTTKH